MTSTTTTNVSFGSLNTSSSGSAKLSTTLFGIDVEKMVDTLVEARSIPNVLRQDKIDTNTARISAYAELETLLTTVNNAAQALRNPSVVSARSDVFDSLQSYSTASGDVDASELYGVSVEEGADIASYSITINQIATKDTISGTVAIADKNTSNPVATDGQLTINGIDVEITSGMSLSEIRDAINDTDDVGVTASIVEAAVGDYRLVLKADETGRAITLSDSETGDILSALGIAVSGETDATLSAEVVLDGVTVTRSSNSLTDLIDGVSIELYDADPGNPIKLSVEADLTSVSDAVSEFLASYNELVDFIKTQRAVTEDGAGDDQVLFSDTIMNSTYRALQSMLTTSVSGTSAVSSLAEIGIELDEEGYLTVADDALFEDALLSNFDDIRSIFGYSYNESSGIVVADRPATVDSAIIGKEVTVRVTATDSEGAATAAEFEVGGTTYAATIRNGLIRGTEGTDLEGFVVGYEGGVLATGETYEGKFTPVQGVADQFAVYLDNILEQSTGTLAVAVSQLEDSTTRLENQIDKLESQLEIYRQTMLSKFDAAQKMISTLESQQTSLKALVDSLTSDN